MSYLDKNQQKSPHKRFLLIFGGLMIGIYTVLGCMFIFFEPMERIIRQEGLRKIVGVCIILYAIIRFSKLRAIYLEDRENK